MTNEEIKEKYEMAKKILYQRQYRRPRKSF